MATSSPSSAVVEKAESQALGRISILFSCQQLSIALKDLGPSRPSTSQLDKLLHVLLNSHF